MLRLPVTSRRAVVFSSPLLQVYSPASAGFASRTTSSATVPRCLNSYFSPSCRTSLPFFHCTGRSGLLSSQESRTLLPSLASLFCSSRSKTTGRTTREKVKQQTKRMRELFVFPQAFASGGSKQRKTDARNSNIWCYLIPFPTASLGKRASQKYKNNHNQHDDFLRHFTVTFI